MGWRYLSIRDHDAVRGKDLSSIQIPTFWGVLILALGISNFMCAKCLQQHPKLKKNFHFRDFFSG